MRMGSSFSLRCVLAILGHLITCCILATGVVYGEDAEVLLHRMQTALGGSRIFQVRDIDWVVKAKVWDGAGNEAGFAIRRDRVILPYQFRKDQDMHVSKDKVIHTRFYFDGKSGWGSFANMATFSDMPVAALEGAKLDMVRKEVRGFWLNLWRAQDYEVSVCAPQVLRFVDKADQNNITEFGLDPDTWLPRGSGECKTTATVAKGNQARITEWIVVDGMKVPKHILNYHAGRLVADIETVTAKFNTGMKAGVLARPPVTR